MDVRHLFSEAGRSALRAFFGSIIVLLPGVLAAPNLNQAYALGVAALIAGLAAAFKALQVFVPQLSFKSVMSGKLAPYYIYVDSFVRAFLGTILTLGFGFLNAPDLSWSKAALVGILVAAVTAGIRAVQGLFTPGEPPLPQKP
jgi:hypothetical protein